jgi:hypothetical protein
MKIRIILTLALLGAAWSTAALSQEASSESDTGRQAPQTLFSMGAGKTTFSGYGAPVYKLGRLKGEYAHYAGLKGGLIVNDSFVIGFAGYGLAHPDRRESYTGREYTEYPYIGFGYGGALVEYTFLPKNLFNFTIGTTIGGGGLEYYEQRDKDDDTERSGKHNSFFVIEPEVSAHINLTRFCKIGAGVSYRYVNGISGDPDFDDSDFSGLHGNVMVSLGWF